MWKLLAVLIVCATVLFLIVPVAITLPMAVSDQTVLGLPAGHFTCRWFEELATYRWREAIGSSLLLGLLSAAFAVVIGALAAFRVTTWPASITAKTLSVLIVAVLIVPPIWLATGYFRLFGEGGLAVLVLPHTLLALPLAFSCIWYGMSETPSRVTRRDNLISLTVYIRFGVVSSAAANVCVFSRSRSRRFACDGLTGWRGGKGERACCFAVPHAAIAR